MLLGSMRKSHLILLETFPCPLALFLKLLLSKWLKVGVVHGGFGGDATRRVVDEHHLEQVETVLVQVLADWGAVVSCPVGERGLIVRVGRYARPYVLMRCTQYAEKMCVSMTSKGKAGVDRITYRKILKISSISESPGNRGFRVHISAKMTPTDHMSTPVEYWRPPRRISGARYHSVTTSWVYVLRGTPNALARPKSASFRFPSLSTSKFCGFRSRCRTLCEWQYLTPRHS